MLKYLTIAIVLFYTLISSFSFAQDVIDCGIQVKDKITVEFGKGHNCMTQTRAETKEEALYTMDKCGPVKYKLSKKRSVFSIFQKDEKDKWFFWGSYDVLHTFSDENNGSIRYTFLCKDGSVITYVPKVEDNPLVILDLVGEERIRFNYN